MGRGKRSGLGNRGLDLRPGVHQRRAVQPQAGRSASLSPTDFLVKEAAPGAVSPRLPSPTFKPQNPGLLPFPSPYGQAELAPRSLSCLTGTPTPAAARCWLDKTQAQYHGCTDPQTGPPIPPHLPGWHLSTVLPQGARPIPPPLLCTCGPSYLGLSSTSCSPGSHLLKPQCLDATSSGKAAWMPHGLEVHPMDSHSGLHVPPSQPLPTGL